MLDRSSRSKQEVPDLKALVERLNTLSVQQGSQRSLKLCARRYALQQFHLGVLQSSSECERNLVIFLEEYIQYVPIAMEEFCHCCLRIDWHLISARVTKLVLTFFQQTPAVHPQNGLISVLDNAYFSHRIIEEIHDHVMCQLGRPLLPWNMITANLIIHSVLGSEHGAKLDQAVIELADQITVNAPKLSLMCHKKEPLEWPCFCQRFEVADCL
jgi:hypothetical protein